MKEENFEEETKLCRVFNVMMSRKIFYILSWFPFVGKQVHECRVKI